MDNICCGDGKGLTIENATIEAIYVNCCCKCGNNGGGDKPEPPTPETPKIYGIRIDKNNPDPAGRITYTNDAVGMQPAFMNFETGVFEYGDWKDVWFVKENKPVMLKYDGTEAYDLDPNDYSKKQNGTPSDVANAEFPGNAMAKMPLVWMKSWEDEQYEYYNVCQTRPDETYHANAFTRADGSVAGCKYLRMFTGSFVEGKLRSLADQSTCNNHTAQQEVESVLSNGILWYTVAFCEWDLIGTLLRLISKSEDSQICFGKGVWGTEKAPTTGMASKKGPFYGHGEYLQQVKVFHMEDWWGGMPERIAGMIADRGKVLVKVNPPYNLTGVGYVDTEIRLTTETPTFTKVTRATPYGRCPVDGGGSDSTYTCDGLWKNPGVVGYAIVGGAWGEVSSNSQGAFAIHLGGAVSIDSWGIGAGLSCEQPKID